MENYDRTMELVNTAYNSAGRASEQFAKYQSNPENFIVQISNIINAVKAQNIISHIV